MEQVTGTVIVKVNGTSIRSKPGASLEFGGFEREPVIWDGKVRGYTEKPVPSMISATLAHTATTDLIAIRDMTDVSGIFETDTGAQYAIRGMFCSKPPKLSGDSGDAEVEFQGEPVQES